MNHYSTLPLTRSRKLDVATQLRDFSAGTISAATEESAIQVLRWHRHEYKAVVDNRAYSGYTEGSAEWNVIIEGAPSEGEAFVELASVTVPGDLGSSEIPLSPEFISRKLKIADVKTQPVLRVKAEPTGSPGELNYSAYWTAV